MGTQRLSVCMYLYVCLLTKTTVNAESTDLFVATAWHAKLPSLLLPSTSSTAHFCCPRQHIPYIGCWRANGPGSPRRLHGGRQQGSIS